MFRVSAMTAHKRVCGGYDGSNDEKGDREDEDEEEKNEDDYVKIDFVDYEEAFEVIYLQCLSFYMTM